MKRNNLLTLFLMAIVLWGLSACSSTGPLTKCPDMKPYQENPVAFKTKKQKKHNDLRGDFRKVTTKVSMTTSLSPKLPAINTLKHQQWGITENTLSAKKLAQNAQKIPIASRAVAPAVEYSIKDLTQSNKTNIAASKTGSKKAFKAKKKEIRHAIKATKMEKKLGFFSMSQAGLMLIIIAVLLPPLAMFIYDEGPSNRFWLSLLLTFIGYLPGQIYTLVVILSD